MRDPVTECHASKPKRCVDDATCPDMPAMCQKIYKFKEMGRKTANQENTAFVQQILSKRLGYAVADQDVRYHIEPTVNT